MKQYTSPNFFNLVVPDNWEYKDEDSIVTLYNSQNGLGAIQISKFSIPTNYKMNLVNELSEFVSEKFKNLNKQELIKNIKERKNLSLVEVRVDQRYWVFYIIFKNAKLLFVSYNCNIEDENKEIPVVYEVIDSINLL